MNAYTLHGQVWDWLGQLTGKHSCCPNRAEELFLFYPHQNPFYGTIEFGTMKRKNS